MVARKIMFAQEWQKAFGQWWLYHYLRSLYGYTAEEMKEYSDYEPGVPFVELAKTKAFNAIPIPDEKDVISDRDPGDENDGDDGKK